MLHSCASVAAPLQQTADVACPHDPVNCPGVKSTALLPRTAAWMYSRLMPLSMLGTPLKATAAHSSGGVYSAATSSHHQPITPAQHSSRAPAARNWSPG